MKYIIRVFLEIGRNLLIGLVAVAISVLALWWRKSATGPFSGALSSVALAAALMNCVLWLIFCAHRLFRRWDIRVVLFVLLLSWGVALYFQVPTTDIRENAGLAERVMASALLAVGSFVPGRGGFETLSGNPGGQVYCHYLLFHSCVALYLGMWFFSVLGSSLVNKIRRRCTSSRRLHVFWGTSRQGILLAVDIMHAGVWSQVEFNFPSGVLADQTERDRLTALADRHRGIWLFLDFDDFGPEAAHGDRHYFLGEDPSENIRLANRLIATMGRSDKVHPEKTFYIRLESRNDEKTFFEWAKWAREQGVNPVIIRENEMIARDFAVQHSPLKAPGTLVDFQVAKVVSAANTLLIGLDDVGRCILRQLVIASRFVGMQGNVVNFPVTVIEKEDDRLKRYCRSAPEVMMLKKEYAIERQPIDPMDDEFTEFMRARRGSFNRIVICALDDEAAVKLALHVTELLKEIGDSDIEVLVKISDSEIYGGMMSRIPGVKVFGELNKIYTRRFFGGEDVDIMAKRLNWIWENNGADISDIKRQTIAIEKSWLYAGYYNREASRASALGEINLLYLLGYERRPQKTNVASSTGGFAYKVDSKWLANRVLSDARLEVLAENEHIRWNAYQRSQGVLGWDMDFPIPLEDARISRKRANQVDVLGRHAALVEYNELPAVDLRLAKAAGMCRADGTELEAEDFEGDSVDVATSGGIERRITLKGYDRRFCAGIFSNTIDAGLEIYRLYGKKPEQIVVESRMASTIYLGVNAPLPSGFEPYGAFLKSLDHDNAISDGLLRFKLGNYVSVPSMLSVKRRTVAKCLYFFNPRTGVILSPEKLGAKSQDEGADEPHFMAQVLSCEGRVVIVFGGTASFRDWKENLTQLRGITPPQFKLASRLVKAVARSCNSQIHMIGHSEGGGEVQFAYLDNFAEYGERLTGSTFNSQRISTHLLSRMPNEAKRCAMLDIVHYRIDNDIVSGMRSLGADLQGIVFNLGKVGGVLSPFSVRKAHNLKSVFNAVVTQSGKQGKM